MVYFVREEYGWWGVPHQLANEKDDHKFISEEYIHKPMRDYAQSRQTS